MGRGFERWLLFWLFTFVVVGVVGATEVVKAIYGLGKEGGRQ